MIINYDYGTCFGDNACIGSVTVLRRAYMALKRYDLNIGKRMESIELPEEHSAGH